MSQDEALVDKTRYTDGGEFTPPPEGLRAFALVKIKNCIKRTQWGDKDAYRFTLRDRDKPECFINITVSTAYGNNSNFKKLLNKMCSGKIPDTVPKTISPLKLAESMIGKWFMGTVVYKEHTNKETGEIRLYANVLDHMLLPHPNDAQWGPAGAYFDSKKAAKATTSLSPHAAPVAPAAPAASAPAAPKSTGFEAMPDVAADEPEAGSLMYAITFAMDKAKQAQQEAFLKSKGGKYFNVTGNWHFNSEVKELEKHCKGIFNPAPAAGSLAAEEDVPPWLAQQAIAFD